MKIWIDATHPNSFLPFLGRSVLEYQLRVVVESERQLRALTGAQAGLNNLVHARQALEGFMRHQVRPSEIRIELSAATAIPENLPSELLDGLNVVWSQRDMPLRARLQEFLRDAEGEPVVALSGDSIVDLRLLEHFIWATEDVAWVTGEGAGRAAILRLTAPLAEEREGENDSASLVAIAEAAKETLEGPIAAFDPETFTAWINSLRRHLPPYLFQIDREETAQSVERFLFDANYKGATDFMTRYVYPPLVWAIVKPLAARRVHPNWVTGVSIFATLAAIPFFALGIWLPGLVLAYMMSVLDSVDGKLARLTFTFSAQGDTLDHGLDIVHPPLWYFAWAWGLALTHPNSWTLLAAGGMVLLYGVDRVLEALFRAATGQSIHGYRPIDVRLRTFISRRNVNLAIFTVALPLGVGLEAFYFIAAWQAFSVLFHLSRVITVSGARDRSDDVAPGTA